MSFQMNASPSPDNPGLINWLLILILGVIWGAAFMSIRVALDGFSPAQVAAGRIGIGALALWLLGHLVGQPLALITKVAGRRGWAFVVIIGAGSIAVPLSLLSWGQQYVPSAFAGVAMGTVPLLVLPLVFAFSPDEGIGPRRVIGMLMGFAGLVIMIGPGAFDASYGALSIWGGLACIASAGCYAVGSILTRRAPKMPPVALASGTLIVAAVIVVPLALIIDELPREFPMRPSAALLYAALFPTALAAIIRVRVITTAGSLFMSLTSYMVPVWSVIFGIALLAEELPAQLYLALALILGGIFIAQSRQIFARLRG
ncbi:MAG: DMT family transporter [Pseudomonadota bacterium]